MMMLVMMSRERAEQSPGTATRQKPPDGARGEADRPNQEDHDQRQVARQGEIGKSRKDSQRPQETVTRDEPDALCDVFADIRRAARSPRLASFGSDAEQAHR